MEQNKQAIRRLVNILTQFDATLTDFINDKWIAASGSLHGTSLPTRDAMVDLKRTVEEHVNDLKN